MPACPAVSVIVSLYNYEKYIGECLDSILNQTFQDFEVIVVDDCSTDNSFNAVKNYIPKFDGRLTLTKMRKNSGGGGEPRNKGFSFSRGEYVFFMDADDVLTPTALEEMYTLAKDYSADVVYCEKYFMSNGIGQAFKENVYLADEKIQQPPFVDRPTLETNDLAERVKKTLDSNYWVTPWLKLVQRDLLVDNDIKFDSLIGSNDFGWSFKVFFCSKRFLRVPNACYIRRMHDESVSLRNRTLPEHIHKWMDRSIRSLKEMDDFMNGIEFFRENPKYSYVVLNGFLQLDFVSILEKSAALSPFDVYDIFRQKFGEYLGKHDVLVSLLCSLVNDLQKNYLLSQEKFEDLLDKYQRHIKEMKRIEREDKAYISELENLVAKLLAEGCR